MTFNPYYNNLKIFYKNYIMSNFLTQTTDSNYQLSFKEHLKQHSPKCNNELKLCQIQLDEVNHVIYLSEF